MLATGSHPFVIMLPQVHKATGNHAFIVHVEKEVKEYGKNAPQQETFHKHWRDILTTKHKLSLAMSNAIRKLLGVPSPPANLKHLPPHPCSRPLLATGGQPRSFCASAPKTKYFRRWVWRARTCIGGITLGTPTVKPPLRASASARIVTSTLAFDGAAGTLRSTSMTRCV